MDAQQGSRQRDRHLRNRLREPTGRERDLVKSGCRGDCEQSDGDDDPPAMRMSDDDKEPPLFDESSEYWDDRGKNDRHGEYSCSVLVQRSHSGSDLMLPTGFWGTWRNDPMGMPKGNYRNFPLGFYYVESESSSRLHVSPSRSLVVEVMIRN
jgi:hypothetical protein